MSVVACVNQTGHEMHYVNKLGERQQKEISRKKRNFKAAEIHIMVHIQPTAHAQWTARTGSRRTELL
jgi:hypothetical protein